MAGVLLPETRRGQILIRLLGLILGGSAVAIVALVAVVLAIGTGGGDASPGQKEPAAVPVADARADPAEAVKSTQLRWIIAGDDLAALRADNAGLARRFFDNSTTFVVGSRQRQDQVPKGYRAIPILTYASLRSFVSDVHAGRVDPRIAAVLYDPESWARTPAAERREPIAAMRQFTKLAGDWGYGTMLSPGRDLALDPDGSCTKGDRELLDQAFLRCGLVAQAGAEVFVSQTAPEELQPELADALIDRTDERLGGAALFATISTSPPGNGEPVYPIDLVRAARGAIGGGAAGLMLNLGSGDVDLAASFLRDLEREGEIDGVTVSEAR